MIPEKVLEEVEFLTSFKTRLNRIRNKLLDNGIDETDPLGHDLLELQQFINTREAEIRDFEEAVKMVRRAWIMNPERKRQMLGDRFA